MAEHFETVETYIASFPPEVQRFLQDVRSTIREAAPGSEESIRYNMPCVARGDRYLIHYAAWKHHVGLYPVPVADELLEAEIAPLRSAKNTVQLKYSDPPPRELLTRIVEMVDAPK